MIRYIKFFFDTISYIASVLISTFFYSEPLLNVIYELNYFLIISGYFLFIASLINYKGYNITYEFSTIREITSIINASVFMVTLSILILFIFQIKTPDFLTASSTIIFSLSIIILPIIFRSILNSFSKDKTEIEPVLLIGLGKMGKSFIDILIKTEWKRFDIIGVLDDNYEKGFKYKNCHVIDNIDSLENIINNVSFNRIIVAVRHLSEKRISYINSISSRYNKPLNFLPSIDSFINDPGKLKVHAGIPLISSRFQPQTLFYLAGKRFLDILFSLLGLIFSIPVWIIVSLLIKKDSNGPVIFKHDRVGLNGNHFPLYKFRSMYTDSPKYAHCPTRGNDPRITKIGKWLRKTSLDELPQLFNVLMGHMSMVGPRPEMPFIVDNYNFIEQKRLLIKPGLTGLWQISPHRSYEISHNLEYDFYYIENQGFVLDIVILILTSFFAIRGLTH